jgi:uncharacterized protein (DUF433 family)
MSEQTDNTTILPTITEHIIITPGVCGGRPRIAGHRITVQNIVLWHERGGMSPDEIASRFSLKLSDVYAALTYYHDHQEEIRSQIEADEQFAEELRSRTPSLLQQQLTQRHAENEYL